MVKHKFVPKPIFSFVLYKKLELKIKKYIHSKNNIEIIGGLIGQVKGKSKNEIVYDVKKFFPFPNMSKEEKKYGILPENWFIILDEWRFFNYPNYKFIGFLHTHPSSTSRLSKQDKQFGEYLKKKYGPLILIIVGKNQFLRCYLFNDFKTTTIEGKTHFYKILDK